MKLTPEERKKIYEEEKARIEAEEKEKTTAENTTGLEQNIAGVLCYVGFWISGIVFLVLEQKNRFVRFHALQSIVTFGALMVAGLLLSWIPIIGHFFGTIIGILAFILWIVLMVKAYQGELYKLPVAGDVAMGALSSSSKTESAGQVEKTKTEPADSPDNTRVTVAGQSTATATSGKPAETEKHIDDFFTGRGGRIVGYGFTIFWDIVLLIFFSYFYQYVAWYHVESNGSVTMLPFFTNAYFMWLPILVTGLAISIVANVVLIIYDKFWLRETVQLILTIVAVVVIANLVAIFPFDFSMIPNVTAVQVVPITLRIVLIVLAVGLGIGAVVQFIKLIVYLVRQSQEK
jgi:uncharacterized membrane protein